jgi:hypothetical protein
MKSIKRIKPGKFRPFANPTSKVREAWSRLFTTLSASAFGGGVVVITNEIYSIQTLLRFVGLFIFGTILQLIAIYVLKEKQS